MHLSMWLLRVWDIKLWDSQQLWTWSHNQIRRRMALLTSWCISSPHLYTHQHYAVSCVDLRWDVGVCFRACGECFRGRSGAFSCPCPPPPNYYFESLVSLPIFKVHVALQMLCLFDICKYQELWKFVPKEDWQCSCNLLGFVDVYLYFHCVFIFTIFFCTSIYLFFSSLCIDDEAKQKNMCVSGYMPLKIRVVRKDFSFINFWNNYICLKHYYGLRRCTALLDSILLKYCSTYYTNRTCTSTFVSQNNW